jgi:hypothetical protein
MRKELEELLEELDWHKIKKVMDFLDWRWVRCENEVPSVAALKEQARELLEELESKPDCNSIYRGGIRVVRFPDEEIMLQFVIEGEATDEGDWKVSEKTSRLEQDWPEVI